DGRRFQASVVELTRHAKKEDAEILVDGTPASEDVRKIFSSLMRLSLDGATDDDVFGTKTPQPIGAHWSVDAALAIVSLKEDGIHVSSVKGEVALDGIARVDGAEYLAIRVALNVGGMRVPNLPEGAEVLESRGEVEVRAALPVDGRIGRPADHELTTTFFRIR